MAFVKMVWDALLWVMGLAKPENLAKLVAALGAPWAPYAVLAAIIFGETGFPILIFLPGDSLLFAAGALAAQHDAAGTPILNLWVLLPLLSAAGILGDAVNYWFGRQAGAKIVGRGPLRFVKPAHMKKAEDFYARHGPKAIVLARFVPVVRTLVPFVAGVGRMPYPQFARFNVLGGVAWVLSMTLSGYYLGQVGFVQRHFEKFVVGIVVVSVLPIAWEIWKARRARPTPPSA